MMNANDDLPDLPDLGRLGIQLDDDDAAAAAPWRRLGLPLDDEPGPRASRDFIAADLVADIQRRQRTEGSPAPAVMSPALPTPSGRTFEASTPTLPPPPLVSHARLQGNAFEAFAPDPHDSLEVGKGAGAKAASPAGMPDSTADVMRFFRDPKGAMAASARVGGLAAGLEPQSGGDRVSANVKALQALQHRSRHPQQSAADVAKNAAFDPSLYGSLPPDIGSLDCTVYVQYLPVTMREVEFMDLIVAHGEPKRVRICGNPKKEHNWTYGFVEYGSPEEAGRFIANCDGIRAGPFRMRCNIAKTPIVDRLAIDAPPDGKCTFAQKFPNRTLRELILASISVSEGEPSPSASFQASASPHGPMGTAALHLGPHSPLAAESAGVALRGIGTPSLSAATSVMAQQPPLSIPADFVLPIVAAAKDAFNFATDRNMSAFFSAKQSVSVVLEHAKRRNETMPPARVTASLLNGTDPVFWCRLLLTALHVLHGSHEEALNHALAALQLIPNSIDVVNYVTKVEADLEAVGAPHGFAPLMLNTLVTFGLVLEPVSCLAARSFFQVAHHRAAVHGLVTSKALDAVLASDLVPVNQPAPPGPDGQPQPTSLLRALFPLLGTQDSSFPGFLVAHIAKSGSLSAPCVNLFTLNAAMLHASEPAGTGNVALGSPLPGGSDSQHFVTSRW